MRFHGQYLMNQLGYTTRILEGTGNSSYQLVLYIMSDGFFGNETPPLRWKISFVNHGRVKFSARNDVAFGKDTNSI